MFWFFFGKFCINADKCDDNCIKTGTSGTEIDKDVQLVYTTTTTTKKAEKGRQEGRNGISN